jgi:hypothetical protein
VACGASSPSDLDKNTQNVKFAHGAGVLDEQHYRSGACVLHGHALFDVNGVYAGVHAYEDGAPCVPPQH